jgi:hypothetical protein
LHVSEKICTQKFNDKNVLECDHLETMSSFMMEIKYESEGNDLPKTTSEWSRVGTLAAEGDCFEER